MSTVSVRATPGVAQRPIAHPNRSLKMRLQSHIQQLLSQDFFGGVFYMPMRQYLLIYTSYIELLFCCCWLCRCKVLGEVLQQQHYAAQPLHYNSVSFQVLQTLRPSVYLFRAIIQLFKYCKLVYYALSRPCVQLLLQPSQPLASCALPSLLPAAYTSPVQSSPYIAYQSALAQLSQPF